MNNKGANKDTIEFFNDSIEKDFNAKVKSKKKVDNIEYINSYKEKFEVYVTRENTHGREEERVYIKSNNISWLKDKKWKHIKCVIMAINNTTVHDNSIRYYFSSVDLPIEELAKIIRKQYVRSSCVSFLSKIIRKQHVRPSCVSFSRKIIRKQHARPFFRIILPK